VYQAGSRKPRQGGASRVNKILTAPRRADSSQYIVRMYGDFGSFFMLQTALRLASQMASRKKSEIVNLKN
jgi:hypothetical protein